MLDELSIAKLKAKCLKLAGEHTHIVGEDHNTVIHRADIYFKYLIGEVSPVGGQAGGQVFTFTRNAA